MTVVTRFAPSPTGFLHIGGVRTALFNWLFSRHHGGSFLLRIEDTDRARSTEAAVDAIHGGLRWLGLDWDGDAISQFARRERHAQVAEDLLRAGKAYRCYATPEELETMRAEARAQGRSRLYDDRWRDRDPAEAPPGVAPVVRIKAPREGETVVADLVQGEVVTKNEQLDDMVLLRSDGTPTYMLAVVVDDHDMGISHVIRGDDHLTNAGRQMMLYDALDWTAPAFAHIPLIHGPDGAKLSKRHGALGVQDYREMGYLPEALTNYLLRLGWSHGDDEIIARSQAIEWFDLDAVGKSPSRFDFDKLAHLNAHYIKERPEEDLVALVAERLAASLAREPSPVECERMRLAMPVLKPRAKTLADLAEAAEFCVATRPLVPDEKAAKALSVEARETLAALRPRLETVEAWSPEPIEEAIKVFAEGQGLKLGKVAQPLRAALTGRTVSPGIFDVLQALGKEESLLRILDQEIRK
ncbi:MAG: glutamate--tRNA ligase [Alphaproteobacteria bacterium]|jgi:glutamyl-tRNA synthetase|nr:glutamate--tRNA ligase [Alphaproteobacteria bacterium]